MWKLICTSDEGCRNTNIIIKQGIPKINMSKTSPSSTLGFGFSPHEDNCDISSEDFVHKDCMHIHQKMSGMYWGI